MHDENSDRLPNGSKQLNSMGPRKAGVNFAYVEMIKEVSLPQSRGFTVANLLFGSVCKVISQW